MDKQTLISKIQQAQVVPELKQKLLSLAQNFNGSDADLIVAIQQEIDNFAAGVIEEAANSELQVATNKYNQDLAQLEQDVNQFSKELNQKADQVDIEEARAQIK